MTKYPVCKLVGGKWRMWHWAAKTLDEAERQMASFAERCRPCQFRVFVVEVADGLPGGRQGGAIRAALDKLSGD